MACSKKEQAPTSGTAAKEQLESKTKDKEKKAHLVR